MYQLFYTPRKERFWEYPGIIMSVRPSVRPSFCLWKFVNGPYILCRNTGSFYFTKTRFWFEGHVCHDLDKNQLFVTFLITFWTFWILDWHLIIFVKLHSPWHKPYRLTTVKPKQKQDMIDLRTSCVDIRNLPLENQSDSQ